MSPAHPKPPMRKRPMRPGRLKGDALAALRAQCFERDQFRCQYRIRTGYALDGSICGYALCWEPVTWDSGHMHHLKTRGAGGKDELSNVQTICASCHQKAHNCEGKPCPPKRNTRYVPVLEES